MRQVVNSKERTVNSQQQKTIELFTIGRSQPIFNKYKQVLEVDPAVTIRLGIEVGGSVIRAIRVGSLLCPGGVVHLRCASDTGLRRYDRAIRKLSIADPTERGSPHGRTGSALPMRECCGDAGTEFVYLHGGSYCPLFVSFRNRSISSFVHSPTRPDPTFEPSNRTTGRISLVVTARNISLHCLAWSGLMAFSTVRNPDPSTICKTCLRVIEGRISLPKGRVISSLFSASTAKYALPAPSVISRFSLTKIAS